MAQKQTTAVAPAAAPTGGAVVGFDDKRGGLTARMAMKFGIEPERFLTTLKQTAFRQRGKNGGPATEVSNEQMAMLLHIAEKYDLDPFARQLYAFPQDGGIVPIVPIDGWIAIVNRHRQFESMEIELPPEGTPVEDYWTEAIITRKDRKKPTRVREWLKECYRKTDPWDEMPKRMLRHKAIIQCARVAFGYSGIFDPDEGERHFANAIDVTPRKEGKPEVREPERKSVAPPPAASPTPAELAAQSGGSPRITMDQATMLADKLKEEGVALNLLLAKFEINHLEDLPAGQFTAAVALIDEASA